jgi:hypothetical protein
MMLRRVPSKFRIRPYSGRELVKSVFLKADKRQLVMAVLSGNDTANLDILREEIGCGVRPAPGDGVRA